MSTLEKVQLMEERIKRAVVLIEKLKTENASLKDEIESLKMHNEELETFYNDYSKNNRLIEEGVTSALHQLDFLEGLAVNNPDEENAENNSEENSVKNIFEGQKTSQKSSQAGQQNSETINGTNNGTNHDSRNNSSPQNVDAEDEPLY